MMNKRSIAFFSLALGASLACNTMTISNMGELKEEIAAQNYELDARARSANNTVMKVESLTKELRRMESQIENLNQVIESDNLAIENMQEKLISYEKIESLLSGGSTFK